MRMTKSNSGMYVIFVFIMVTEVAVMYVRNRRDSMLQSQEVGGGGRFRK